MSSTFPHIAPCKVFNGASEAPQKVNMMTISSASACRVLLEYSTEYLKLLHACSGEQGSKLPITSMTFWLRVTLFSLAMPRYGICLKRSAHLDLQLIRTK